MHCEATRWKKKVKLSLIFLSDERNQQTKSRGGVLTFYFVIGVWPEGPQIGA